MPAPRSSELVQLHAAALEAAALYSGKSQSDILRAVQASGLAGPVYRGAFGVALVALAATKTTRAAIGAVMTLEAVHDPFLRDAGYRAYRLKQTPEEIAIAQGLRTITIRQNLRRLERTLSEATLQSLSLSSVEPPLSNAELKTALDRPERSSAGGHVADAFACAAWEGVRETVIGIGKRSVRPVRGRVWIDPTSPRIPSARMHVAEAPSAYSRVRAFDVRKQDQGWEVRIAISEDGVAVNLVSGDGVVIGNSDGGTLGICTPRSPSLPLPGITLPAELCIRKLGTGI